MEQLKNTTMEVGQKKNKPKSKVNKKVIIGFCLGLILLWILGEIRDYLIEKEGVYTIATVYKTKPAGRGGGVRIYYHFDYKNKRYTASYIDHKTIGINDIGRNFYTKILPQFPNIGLVYPRISLPSDITEAPPEGWKELPVRISK